MTEIRGSGVIWLAKDKNNCLATFEAGNSGPIPKELRAARLDYDTLAKSLHFVNRSEFSISLSGHLEPGREQSSFLPLGVTGELGEVLAFTPAEKDVLEQYKEFKDSFLRACDHGTALFFREQSKAFLQKLSVDQRLTASFWPAKHWSMMLKFAQQGIYCYSHLSESWTAGPYGCKIKTLNPISLSEITWQSRPEDLQILDFSALEFAKETRIQVADYFDCFGTDLGILQLDGELGGF